MKRRMLLTLINAKIDSNIRECLNLNQIKPYEA